MSEIGSLEPIPFAGCIASPADALACRIVLLGVPIDTQSSFLRGCAEAPDVIRRAYDGRSFNSTTESGIDLSGRVCDMGNLTSESRFEDEVPRIADRVRVIVSEGRVPFFLGGDHSVTIPLVEGFAAYGSPVHVIQIDAHPDLYPSYGGDRYSHACTAARLLEMNHVASVTQVGIRCMNSVQEATAVRHRERLFSFPASQFSAGPIQVDHIQPDAPVYLTVDLDGIDPAFAPGVSHPVPGGLSSRQVLDLFHSFRWRLAGMDVVEVNPSRDFHHQTSILAARILHEGMGVTGHESRITNH